MKIFLVINGAKAWITERKTMESAVQSAVNLCDHSYEIIVREIEEFTDYTKVFKEIPKSVHPEHSALREIEESIMNDFENIDFNRPDCYEAADRMIRTARSYELHELADRLLESITPR